MLQKSKLSIVSVAVLCILFIPMAGFSAEKKVVRIWHTETEPQTIAAFQEIINDYEKLHPDVSIK